MDKGLLSLLLQRPIAFHKVFVDIGGSIPAGLFLSQLWYWSDKGSDPDGWIYKTMAEWKAETGMTRFEQETARSKLRSKGLLEEVKRGIPAYLFYRINEDNLLNLLNSLRMRESSILEGGNPASLKEGIQHPITESTKTEITSENTKISYYSPNNTLAHEDMSEHRQGKPKLGDNRGKKPAYSEGFLAFWAAYPRKVAKGAAWKAWKSQGCELLTETIVLSVLDDPALKFNGQFTPYPATWLSGRRWEDDPGPRQLGTGGNSFDSILGTDAIDTASWEVCDETE